MSSPATQSSRRILVIDDNPAIHDALRKIFSPKPRNTPLEQAEAALFDETEPSAVHEFEMVSAYQGEEGIECARKALEEKQPFAMAFVDIRMPPGLDGVETTLRLWGADPGLQVVICTAHSDYSFNDLSRRLGVSDRILILKKPFDVVEVLQLAYTLSEKWRLQRLADTRMSELDRLVRERTTELRTANEKLARDLAERQRAQKRIAAFASLGLSLSAAKTAREAAVAIVDIADQLLGWDACYCELYVPEQDFMQHVLFIDLIDGVKTLCDPVNESNPPTALTRRVIQEGGFFLCHDNPQHMRKDAVPFGNKSRPSASLLFVPIRHASKVIGVLSIQSYQSRAYHTGSLETLQALADHCGGALERIRSEEVLRATRDQLRQAQKMEAIGQLAGGIAHDFNNVLAVIRGNAEFASMQAKGLPHGVTDCLDQVIAAADRAAHLARQMLTFSRKQMMTAQPVCLNHTVMNLTKMLKRVITEEIQLQCHYYAGLPNAKVDTGMIEQVLMNLAVNARDAMPRGGHLEISTGLVHFESEPGSAHPEGRPGEFVTITVRDSGTGIDPDHVPHLFEPFFTTKDVGKGTGLGLATVYGIVKQHEGWIEVATEVGTGTAFTFYIPALTGQVEEPPPPPVDIEAARGTETILLVEDEDSVRTIMRRFLETHGYRVFEAGSGPDALRLWEGGKEADLLLTDIIMPDGMNGRQLAERLRAKKPSLKVIFISGYAGDVLGPDLALDQTAADHFLQKPFSPTELLQVLRRTFDPALT
jgi:signal transduction histidine kinase/DNA-binding response OmpR family regulator